MDPVNERKVFDIIVKNSSLKTSAQYFLLTPKVKFYANLFLLITSVFYSFNNSCCQIWNLMIKRK